MIEELWYKNAVIYCLDVETFVDGNGDGVGDFEGLMRHLDHVAGLGATCIWLLPFYRTTNRDNGYDVVDYFAVDERLGDLGDFVQFSHEARRRGLRVIVDLVVNHTSDQHPWFQAARRDRRSRYRDYYVWSDTEPEGAHQGMVFPPEQESTWTYDEVAGAWYYHRFWSFQPDLDVTNPAVREEIERIMGFWLQLGVSGFRIDAVPFLLEGGHPIDGDDDVPGYARELRAFCSWRRGDALLLAEANLLPDEARRLFDDGGSLQMIFDFPANQHLFLALADGDARPLGDALEDNRDIPGTCQWARFLRNHDELDLGRLEDAERERVFARFGPEERMQIFGRGLRRRLAPMLGGDQRLLEMVHSLVLTLPGTPVLWYGDEIGMGEDLSLEGRDAVRTPMQWSDAAHGGFTRADAPFRPVVREGPFGFGHVNVARARRDPASLLNVVERLVRLRKECPELGLGDWQRVEVDCPAVLALRFTYRGVTTWTVHNLGRDVARTVLRGGEVPVGAPLVDLVGGDHVAADDAGGYAVELPAYGYRWYRVEGDDHALRPLVSPRR